MSILGQIAKGNFGLHLAEYIITTAVVVFVEITRLGSSLYDYW